MRTLLYRIPSIVSHKKRNKNNASCFHAGAGSLRLGHQRSVLLGRQQTHQHALANKILISAGAGFLTITDRHMEQFNTLLVDYYNTGKSEALKDFLYENAIQGIF